MNGSGAETVEDVPRSADRARTPNREEEWRPTRSLIVGMAFSVILLMLAVLRRREDSLIIAIPMMVGTALALLRRPFGGIEVRLRAPERALLEDEVAAVTVTVAGDESIDLVCVSLDDAEWVKAEGRPEMVVVGADGPVEFRLRCLRWGRHDVGPAAIEMVGAHGLLRRGTILTETVSVAVLPLRKGFDAIDAMPRAAGMVGLHNSRRRGDGADVSGVRPFVSGDRLRRINWPVSLRSGKMHVTATVSDLDTDVVLVLDTHYDVGVSQGVDGESSSLDTAVRAAASVAEHYLRHGDRVGLIDLGQPDLYVRPSAGRRHFTRLLSMLLGVDHGPAGRATTSILPLMAMPRGALVLMLSPLVGDDVFGRAAGIARSGRILVIVDTLPNDYQPPRRSEWTAVAYRLWLLERSAGIARLGELGVPVTQWHGAGSLDEVLRGVTRAGRPNARVWRGTA